MKEVLIGISGGIDSAVSATILKDSGYNVTGVYLYLNENETDSGQKLEKIKRDLGINIIEHDCRREFEQKVVKPFVDSYCAGRTPNPCITCNAEVKFQALLNLADERDIPYISTGHYAEIEECLGNYFINRGKDSLKDQSYMLYRLKKGWLHRIIFPLGSLEKETVREIGEKLFHEKINKQKESQDICFIKDMTHANFIRQRCNIEDAQGPIIDVNGGMLGKHTGITGYTIGQRKGLGLSGGPWFVCSIDPDSNTVFVSSGKVPDSDILTCSNAVWHDSVDNSEIYHGQHRYRATPFPLKVISSREDCFVVKTCKPVKAPAPGQSLVIYNGNRVIGGGIINSDNKEVKK